MIAHLVKVTGSGKEGADWFKLDQLPALQWSLEAALARKLVEVIQEVMRKTEAGGFVEKAYRS